MRSGTHSTQSEIARTSEGVPQTGDASYSRDMHGVYTRRQNRYRCLWRYTYSRLCTGAVLVALTGCVHNCTIGGEVLYPEYDFGTMQHDMKTLGLITTLQCDVDFEQLGIK